MKKLILTTLILCLITNIIYAQESEESVKVDKKDNGVVVSIKDTKDATIYIDGKKYENDILKIIDVNKIESIEVFKGEEAINAYGSDKVILIHTKKTTDAPQIKIRDKENAAKLTFRDLKLDGDDESKYPLILIDKKKATVQILRTLDPDSIYSIKILHDTESKNKYNTDNGVIIVTTKKNK